MMKKCCFMSWNNFKNTLKVFVLAGALVGCTSEYEKKVKEGLALKEDHPELIFDIEMGQTQKDFFGKCWELNKKGLVAQGPSNQYVRHVLDQNSPLYQPDKNMELLFYGLFDEANIIRGMRFRISYLGWGPWIEDMQSQYLMRSVKTMMMELYGGNPFFELNEKVNDHPIAVKIDGSRQITVFVFDNRFVHAIIEDLNYKS